MKRVQFKCEDVVDGEEVGPVSILDGESDELRPFDPNERVRWVTQSQAEAIAAEHGVELETS